LLNGAPDHIGLVLAGETCSTTFDAPQVVSVLAASKQPSCQHLCSLGFELS
jgi:hypothetical protein